VRCCHPALCGLVLAGAAVCLRLLTLSRLPAAGALHCSLQATAGFPWRCLRTSTRSRRLRRRRLPTTRLPDANLGLGAFGHTFKGLKRAWDGGGVKVTCGCRRGPLSPNIYGTGTELGPED